MAMAQIRQIIELLSVVLRENGVSAVKAETFRQAKFDKDEAVVPLWNVLFEMVYFCEYGKIDDGCTTARSTLTQVEQVIYVKGSLQREGYTSLAFNRLPADMSSGSRELLLAFGWLLGHYNVIDKFMRRCTVDILVEEDTSHLHQAQDNDLHDNFEISKKPEELVNQLLWLNNKLRLSLRSLHAAHSSNLNMSHKAHVATESVTIQPLSNHLSVLEIDLLRHPLRLQRNLELLEKDNQRLQNLLDWRKHEDVFWKWMESVLDAKLLSESEHKGMACGDKSQFDVAKTLMRGVADTRLSLQEDIIKFESAVNRLDALWEQKRGGISSAELENVLQSIKKELSVQKASVPQPTQQPPTQPCFLIKPKSAVTSVHNTQITSELKSSCLLAIQEEINRLESLCNEAKAALAVKEIAIIEALQALSLPNAVTLPPRLTLHSADVT